MTVPPAPQPPLAQQLAFTGPLEGAVAHVLRFTDPEAGTPTLLLSTSADLGQPVTVHVTRYATDDLEVTGSHHGQPAHLGFFTVPGLRDRWQAELDAAAQARRQEDLLRQPWTFVHPLTP
ncbi:hypothetical protein [Deinococcus radiotolerans]|uniref:Uncharacterized protein n=1 Tax=Deinococcus radiotolerans TaxID=1309407 RepID=A0ABQ2FQG2_9DEIO|nr:hypothetical protein [Deinococcus radiotolerans]GGL16800.1 hypothetical protein GCM10010844_39660 [Deinococcus radiotolerans]